MANLGINFNASDHEDMADFTPVPVGDYVVIMKDSEVKETKNGKGAYLNCTFEIIEGQFRGRLLFSILNLWNQNETAVKIAKQELATIGRACGVLSATDSSMFHNRPMIAHVAIEESDPKYGPKNVIKNYKSVNGSGVATSPSTAMDANASVAPGSDPAPSQESSGPLAEKPWKRNG